MNHLSSDGINQHLRHLETEQPAPVDALNTRRKAKDENDVSLQPDTEVSLLEMYDPSQNPVLGPDEFQPDKKRPVHVQLVVGAPKEFLANTPIPVESIYLFDGLGRSDFINVTELSFVGAGGEVVASHNAALEAQPTVWIVDFSSLQRDCHSLESMVRATVNEWPQKGWYLVLMDSTGSSEVVVCPRLEALITRKQIRLVKRGIVDGRHWDSEHEWVNIGAIVPNQGHLLSGGPILYMPIALQEKFVVTMSALLSESKSIENMRNPADISRSTDVAHFWTKGDHSHYAFLREKVGNIINSMEKMKTGGRTIHTVVNFFEEDENPFPITYIKALLSSKIVVIAQRDEWEDHHRLLEALACGAMVVTDMMLGLPKGLEHKKNVILYNSTETLTEAIRYYLNPKHDKERLEIARSGFNVAMGQHRSWHRMEEILFGKPLTMVDKPFDTAPKNVLSAKKRRRRRK